MASDDDNDSDIEDFEPGGAEPDGAPEVTGGDSEGRDVQSSIVANQAPATANVDLAGNPVTPSQPPAGYDKVAIEKKGYHPPPPPASGLPSTQDVERQGEANQGVADRGFAMREDAEAKISGEQAKYEAALADIEQRQSDMDMWAAGMAQRVHDAASKEAKSHLAAFEEKMAAARQMAVDPTGPIGRMNGWQAAGMTLANFAQGFLAARGIKIDVSGQMDRWIERDLEEQKARRENAIGEAKDQLTLAEVVRQGARDDVDFMNQYRGMTISALQAQVRAQAAQFKSATAQADAEAKVGELEVERGKTRAALYAQTYNQVHANETLKETHWYHQGMLSLEQQRVALARDKANAKSAQSNLVPVPDPSNPSSTLGYMSLKDPRLKDISTKGEYTQNVMKKADEVLDLHDKLEQKGFFKSAPGVLTALVTPGTSGMIGAAAMADKDYSAYIAGLNDLKSLYLTNRHGKRISGEMFNKMGEIVPTDTLLRNGGGIENIYQLKEATRQDFEGAAQAPGLLYDKEGASIPADRIKVGPGVRSDYEAGVLGAGGKPKDEVQLETQQIVAGESNQHVTRPSPLWKSIMGDRPMPVQASMVDSLVGGMVNPAAFSDFAGKAGHTVPESEAGVRTEIASALRNLAQRSTDEGLYVKGILGYAQAHPEEFRRVVEETAAHSYGLEEGAASQYPEATETP